MHLLSSILATDALPRVSSRHVDLVGILKHDGYLNNQEDPAHYRFNSPVIREWWWRNVAN